VYRDGTRVADINIHEVAAALQQPDTFVWVALHEPSEELLLEVQKQFGLHELAIEDALSPHERPKLEQYGDVAFVVVNTALLWHNEVLLGETHLFACPRFVVTVRHGSSIDYSQVRERLEAKPPQLASGATVVHAILDFIVDNYHPIVDSLQQRFEALETAMFKGEFDRGTIGHMYDLKRKFLRLRSAAAPMRDITDRLLRFHPVLVPQEMHAYFRDVHDHAARVVATTDEMREMLTAAMQTNLAFVSIQQNDVVKRLAGWGAILAVPTVVFSLYGMNFRHMPELDSSFGYPLVLAGTLLACGWLYWRLRVYGWL
jgi:magnesium transporter